MKKGFVRKVFAGLLALSVLAVSLTGCIQNQGGGSSAPVSSAGENSADVSSAEKQNMELDYFHLGDWPEPIFTQAAEDYEAETGIHVNIEYGTWDGGYEKYLTMINSDTLPDGGFLYSQWTGEFYERGVINPIYQFGSQEFMDDFTDAVKESLNYTGDGVISYPFISSIRPYIYRPEVLEQAGVAVPEKIEDIVTVAQATHDAPNMYGYGLCAGRNKYTIETWLPIFWTLGGEMFNEDNTKAAFNSEAGVKATQMFSDLAQTAPEGYLTSDAILFENVFQEGKLSQLIYGGWVVPNLKNSHPEAEYAIVPALEGPNGEKVCLYVIDTMAIFTKDTDRAKALTGFFEFAKGDEKYFGQSYSDYNLVPDMKRQYDWAFASDNELVKAMIPCVDYARQQPMIPQWSQVTDIFSVELASVCSGQKTAEQAIADAEQQVNQLLSE